MRNGYKNVTRLQYLLIFVVVCFNNTKNGNRWGERPAGDRIKGLFRLM